MSKTRGLWVAGAVALVVLVLLMPHLLGTYYLSLLTESLLFAVAALSLDLVWGYTGIPDLGHALWFGTGALAVGMMTTKLDPTGLVLGNYGGLGRHIAGIVIGMVVAGAIALAVGLLSFSQGESDPFYIAIVTLALTVVAGTLYGQTTQWTGGDNGLFGFAYHGYSGTTWYYICAVLLIVIAAGALALVRSDFGLVIKAIRDNQRRVRFFGTNVEAVKIGVFVLGAVLAALAGGVYATIVGFVSAPLFGFLFSTQILIWVAVGGRGTIIGPVLGAIGLSFVTSKLNASYPTEWSLFLGLLFVTVVVFVPDGVFPPLARLGRSLLHRRRPAKVSRVLTSAPRARPSSGRAARRSRSSPSSSSPTARSRFCAGSTSRSRRASCSASSGRTAPASRRCSTSSPTGSCRPAARSSTTSTPASWRGGGRRSTASRVQASPGSSRSRTSSTA